MTLNEQSLIKLAELIQSDEYFYSYVGGDFEYLAKAFKEAGIAPNDLELLEVSSVLEAALTIVKHIDLSKIGAGIFLNTEDVASWHKHATIKMILHFHGVKR